MTKSQHEVLTIAGWGGATLPQDVKVEASDLGDKNGIAMHHKLPVELCQDHLGLG